MKVIPLYIITIVFNRNKCFESQDFDRGWRLFLSHLGWKALDPLWMWDPVSSSVKWKQSATRPLTFSLLPLLWPLLFCILVILKVPSEAVSSHSTHSPGWFYPKHDPSFRLKSFSLGQVSFWPPDLYSGQPHLNTTNLNVPNWAAPYLSPSHLPWKVGTTPAHPHPSIQAKAWLNPLSLNNIPN